MKAPRISEAEKLVDEETERLANAIRARPPSDVDTMLNAAIAILDGRPVPDDAYRILASRRPHARRR